jgi:hypothetical protein
VSSNSRQLAAARCNIGPAEISRRRRFAIVLSLAAFALAVGLVASGVPHLLRAVLWPVAAAASVTWLQVVRGFCVRFGAAGVENYGDIGPTSPVERAQAEADRRRAAQIVGEGVLAGLLASVALVNLPL